MKREFVPYGLALKLKALGFDEPCFGYWNKDPQLKNPTFNMVKPFEHEWCLPAPTFSQAFRFFREKGYDVNVQKESEGLYFGFYWSGVAWVIVGQGAYEEAELACLDRLIEIVEAKSE